MFNAYRKPLTGAPRLPRFGADFDPNQHLPVPGMGLQQPLPQPQEAERKPSFFGEGGVGRAIAGTVGDALLMNNGNDALYTPIMAERRASAARLAAEAAKRQNELQDYEAKKQIDQRYQAPDTFERALAGGGIDPKSEQGRQLYLQRAESMARDPNDEFVVVPIPGRGTYAGPRSGLREAMGQGLPTAPVGRLTPLNPGGGAGNSVGGFPR